MPHLPSQSLQLPRSLFCIPSLSSCLEPMATCPLLAHHNLPPGVSKYIPQKETHFRERDTQAPMNLTDT